MKHKPIRYALREAKLALWQIALFNSAIDTVVVLMLFILCCLLFSFPQWYALVPTFFYAILHTYGNVKEIKFSTIEKKFPVLDEQLITVADNLKENNEIIDSLNQEVLAKMKQIRTSAFLDFGRLTREITVLAIVSFIIIGCAAFNVEFLDFNKIVEEIKDFQPGDHSVNQQLLEFEESQNLSEILGDESITELGQKQLDLELNPIMSDVVIGSIRPVEDRSFREVPPPEIKADSDSSYEEDIPKEYQKIVKTYFREITKS